MPEKRYPELDALRGIAVLGMVLYHFLFDLAYFYRWDIPVGEGSWRIFATFIAAIFLLLIGICFVISWERRRLETRSHVIPSSPSVNDGVSRDRHHTFWSLYPTYLKRGFIIFSGGMLITFVTWSLAPDFYVKFGILHLIGISTLLLPFFASFKYWNFLLGVIVLFVFFVLPKQTSSVFFFPLGFPSPNFASLDYFPLVPWFGVILIGMTLGSILYVPKRHPALALIDTLPFPLWLLGCGKCSLWIYFLHQPLILLLLNLILGMPTRT